MRAPREGAAARVARRAGADGGRGGEVRTGGVSVAACDGTIVPSAAGGRTSTHPHPSCRRRRAAKPAGERRCDGPAHARDRDAAADRDGGGARPRGAVRARELTPERELWGQGGAPTASAPTQGPRHTCATGLWSTEAAPRAGRLLATRRMEAPAPSQARADHLLVRMVTPPLARACSGGAHSPSRLRLDWRKGPRQPRGRAPLSARRSRSYERRRAQGRG